MSGNKTYSGVIVPMVTPFTSDSKIDWAAVEKLVNNFIVNDAYPLVLGTTGECASIHENDKIELVRFLAAKFGHRTKIYVMISDNCFQKSVEMAKQYFDFGIELMVSLLPNYYLLNRKQIQKYYELLADQMPGKLFLYNIPATTRISIPIDVIDELSYHEKIVGIKDSEQDLARLNTSIAMWKDRDDFAHFIGWGAQCFHGLWQGSDGIVPSTGNFCPSMYKVMYDAVLYGEKAKGEQAQIDTMKIAAIYQKDRILSESLAALKVMLQTAGLCSTTMLPPITTLNPDEESQVRVKTAEVIEQYHLSWV